MFRLLFVTFALAIMCVIVMVLVLPSDSEGKTYNRNAASSNTRHAGYESTALKPWPVLEKTTTYPTLVKHGSYQTPPMALQEPEGQKISASTPQWFPGDPMPLPAADHSIESRRNTIGGRSTFEESLSRVFSLLPDEIHVRELLRPIEGTGKEKLRETGVRVRAFKTFFEAWEALHLVAKDGIAYVRDDIVQYMRSHHDEASKLTLAQKIRSYEVYRHFLQLLSTMLFPWTAPYFADHMNLHAHFRNGGRGIVLSAGDDQAPFLLVSIPSFRRLGCTLPIEVMYLGDSDLSEDYRAELELLPGVITRDLSQMVSDEGWRLAGWASKPFAILLSSFREVIFIDADALFLRDPEILFQDPSYAQTGALFFKDRRIMPESKKRWLQQILPKPVSKQVMQSHFWTGTSGHMQESGVVVIDKWKHFVAMLLVTRMNGPDRDGNEEKGEIGVYDMVYGDKETFWLGWELTGDLDYAFHGGSTGIMGKVEDRPSGEQADTVDGETDKDNPASAQEDVYERDQGATEVHTTQEPESETVPENYTICAPQLLHFDKEGHPLWFNGWILSNKYAEKSKREANTFERYMMEPDDARIGETDAWQLTGDNICCLTSDHSFSFSREDEETLKMIATLAKSAGAYGKT